MVTAAADPHRTAPAEQRFLLRGISWSQYQQIADALTGRHVRLTYDRGALEFMTISSAHARLSRLLGQFVIVLTEELGLPRLSFGDMTCNREELERGLEPDECFYITNEASVRGRDDIDLANDPPPDLAIEIDLSSPKSRRSSIYAALGVPEVWLCDGKRVTALVRTAEGRYEESERSRCVPPVRVADLDRFLARRNEIDEATLVREFRGWAAGLVES